MGGPPSVRILLEATEDRGPESVDHTGGHKRRRSRTPKDRPCASVKNAARAVALASIATRIRTHTLAGSQTGRVRTCAVLEFVFMVISFSSGKKSGLAGCKLPATAAGPSR